MLINVSIPFVVTIAGAGGANAAFARLDAESAVDVGEVVDGGSIGSR
jgi:hypothetical protein